MSETSKLQQIIDFGLGISRINDVDILLEKILQNARVFTNADAGSIYLREGDRLLFSYTQNDTLLKQSPDGRKLIYSTFSIPIDKKSIAGFAALTGTTVRISDVNRLAADVPYSFDSTYDHITGYRTKSVLTFPLKQARGEVVGVLQLINAKNGVGEVVPFPVEQDTLLFNFAENAASAVERAKLTRGIIIRMNKMAELRDPSETASHVKRVSAYSAAIYEAWAHNNGIGEDEIERNRDLLRVAAMLHDVGKVAISDVIMKKPGMLTNHEFDVMKQHTLCGARLFDEIYSEMDEAARAVSLNHHERWDGSGYPGHVDLADGSPMPGYQDKEGKALGKKGEEIPLFGRIVAIADVYDALRSRRCYKEAWDEGGCLEKIRSEAGKQFDPELVACFFQNLELINHISRLYPDDENREAMPAG